MLKPYRKFKFLPGNSGLKQIFLLTAIVGCIVSLRAQTDSLSQRPVDSLSTDSVYSAPLKNKNAITSQIDFTADDSIFGGVASGEARLYNNAFVKYEDLTIKAGYIYVNFETNEMFASGLPDSNGVMQQKPVFTEGGKSYRSDEMRYNFDSKKAKIKKVITTEGEGFLHGENVKKTGDNVFYVKNASYTTCSHEHPHFRIVTPKAKVITGEKVVTQFAYLELVDIPTPLMVPFGFFPTTQKRKSGIIIPAYGNSQYRGYFLTNGGFYWAANDYFDLSLTGDIYTQGGYGWRTSSNYRKRYAYSGRLGVSYNLLKYGREEFVPYISSAFDNRSDYAITWSHQQDPKANPYFRFNASVNIASGSYYQITSRDAQDVVNNSLNSSISASQIFPGKPLSLNVSARHTQNNQSKDITFTLPEIAFNVTKRIYPFKRKISVGKKRWYEEINLGYNMAASNEISTKLNKPIFTETVFRDSSRAGVKHSIPISANYKLFKHIVFSPSVNYTQRWYFDRADYYYDQIQQRVINDTISGFFVNQDFNARANFSTRLYGMYNYRSRYFKAMRHVMTPQIGFSYSPDFSTDFWGSYQEVQVDSLGNLQRLNRYNRGIFGSAGAQEQGNITFGLQNTLEAKVRSKNDTTGFEKIKILEGLSINSAYNIAAEEFNLQPVTVRARTSTLDGLLQFNFTSTYDYYGYDEDGGPNGSGIRVNRPAYEVNRKLLRNTSQNFSTSINLSANDFNRKKSKEPLEGSDNDEKEGLVDELPEPDNNLGISAGDRDYYRMPGYVDFSAPWTLNVDYTIQKNYSGLQSQISQSLSFRGDVKLTENWKVGFSSGYDFEAEDFVYTTLDFYRDLHCWQLRATWVPFGFQQSYMITLQVKSSVLSDLKLERRRGIGDFER